jgi:hypothetical protein
MCRDLLPEGDKSTNFHTFVDLYFHYAKGEKIACLAEDAKG